MSDFQRVEFSSKIFGDGSREDRAHLDLGLEPYQPVSMRDLRLSKFHFFQSYNQIENHFSI